MAEAYLGGHTVWNGKDLSRSKKRPKWERRKPKWRAASDAADAANKAERQRTLAPQPPELVKGWRNR